MTKKDIIKYSAFGIIAIAVIILIVSLITAYKNKTDEMWKQRIKDKDETIKAISSERDSERQLKDYAIYELHKKDSLLQTRYKTNTIIYGKIPDNINSLDREGLRAAGERAAQ